MITISITIIKDDYSLIIVITISIKIIVIMIFATDTVESDYSVLREQHHLA